MINLFELDSNLVRDPFTAKLAFCVCMVSTQILVLERVWGRASRSTGVSCGQKVDFNPFLELFAATTPASLPKTLSRAQILRQKANFRVTFRT